MASTYTPEVGEQICEHIAGGLSLDKIAALPGMPTKMTIRAWRRAHPEFDIAYFAAKKFCDEDLVDKLQALNVAAVGVARGEDDPRRANVIVNAMHNQAQDLKWLIAKLAPRYSDKVGLVGQDGEGPIEVIVRKIGGDNGEA